MKKLTLSLSVLAATGLILSACSSDDNNNSSSTAVTKEAVVANYAKIVYQNYADALNDANELEQAINTFTANPTNDNFTAAKTKWKEARESYGTTEAFRFANGPIDNDQDYEAPEGLMNSWPLDENYIDYVDNNGTPLYGGIINNAALYPSISKDMLAALNTDGGEENISTGYHAIEFLLWGQDLTLPAANLPGQRQYTDYVAGGTVPNTDRRAAYLNACADLLTDNLSYLVDEWKEGGDYRTTFLALPVDTALQNMYLGIVTLSSSELPVERMQVALDQGKLEGDISSQENEHSCFSDNTHRDIALNLQGVINVYKGQYGNISGPSLEDLVQQKNNTLYTDTVTAIDDAVTDVAAMGVPFDLDIYYGKTSPLGAPVKVAYLQIETVSQELLAGATALGITVNGI